MAMACDKVLALGACSAARAARDALDICFERSKCARGKRQIHAANKLFYEQDNRPMECTIPQMPDLHLAVLEELRLGDNSALRLHPSVLPTLVARRLLDLHGGARIDWPGPQHNFRRGTLCSYSMQWLDISDMGLGELHARWIELRSKERELQL